MKKSISFSQFAIILGNILEHKDRALFSLLAPFIASQYFPSDDFVVSLIQMYGLLVLSLFVKPLGALLLGRLADQKGRKKALVTCIGGMSIATLGMGVLPSYESIGLIAPLLLFILRSFQNFFGAAEATNSAVFLLEHSEKKSHSWVSSLFEASSMIGVVWASLEMSLLAAFGILESHWRWLFMIAGVLGLLSLYFRRLTKESPDFSKTTFDLKALILFRTQVLLIAIAASFSQATYLLSITFVNGFLKVYSSLSDLELTNMNSFLTLVDLVALPLFGYLTFRVPTKKMMAGAALLTGVFAVPLFLLMGHYPSLGSVLFVRFVIVVLGVSFAAPYRAWAQELVIAEKRCTVINLGGALGQLFAAGPLTIVSLWAMQSGYWLMPALLLAGLGFAAAGCVRSKPTFKAIAVDVN